MSARRWWAVCLCLPGLAWAQLNPAWDGQWIARESSTGSVSVSLQIRRTGGQSWMLQNGQRCLLAYDGTVAPAALLERVAKVQAWQLNPSHWSGGGRTGQLIGLQKEFDAATRLLTVLTATNYRQVRIRGYGCEDADDIAFVLHQNQHLLRIRFPSAALGVEVTAFRRTGGP
jgi:hypothetical protein